MPPYLTILGIISDLDASIAVFVNDGSGRTKVREDLIIEIVKRLMDIRNKR
jgi:hypothetical protein